MIKWNGDIIKDLVKDISKKAVKETAEIIAEGAKRDVNVDTGETRDSIHVKTWEKEDVVGAYVKAGAKGKEEAALIQEIGSINQNGNSFLRKNLNKNKGKLKTGMTGKLIWLISMK